MRRAGLTGLLVIAAVCELALVAEFASASRPFSHAVLRHPATEPGLHNWLIIRTVTGPDEPRRMSARAGGVSAPAREIHGAHGRWIVNRRTLRGRALIRALREDLGEWDAATLHAVGRYQCRATFRVFFRIKDYNEPAPSEFEDATGCEALRRYRGAFVEQTASAAVRTTRKDGDWYFRRFSVRGLEVPCSDGSSRTVKRAIRDRVKIGSDGAFFTKGRNGRVDDGSLIKIGGTVGSGHASGSFSYFHEKPAGGVCETGRLHWDAPR